MDIWRRELGITHWGSDRIHSLIGLLKVSPHLSLRAPQVPAVVNGRIQCPQCTYNVHTMYIQPPSAKGGTESPEDGIRLLSFLPRLSLSLSFLRGWKRRRHWDMCYSKLIIFLGLEIGKMLRSCGRIRYFYVAICS